MRQARNDIPTELESVRAWTGPIGTNQDFELDRVAIEAKTSSANSHQKLHISDARQLDTTGIDSLYISFWSLDVRHGHTDTLPMLVDSIRTSISSFPATLSLFSERLVAAGYLDIHVDKYSSTSYGIRRHLIFGFDQRFPHIDLQMLPAGVGDLRYTIEVSACREFSITDAVFAAQIRATNA